MNRRIVIWIAVIVLSAAFIIFFYPRQCGNYGTSTESVYHECECFGLKDPFWVPIPAGGGYSWCYGICGDCTCHAYVLNVTAGNKFVDAPVECP